MDKNFTKKLGMSFAAFGLSAEECGEGIKLFRKSMGNDIFVTNLKFKRHREKCVLIAQAMAATASPKKKSILWNLFKNTNYEK